MGLYSLLGFVLELGDDTVDSGMDRFLDICC